MKKSRIAAGLGLVIVAAAVAAVAYWHGAAKKEGIRWPQNQALPSFPKPADRLDLISLNTALVYEGEGSGYGQTTGKADGGSWHAVAGTDKAGELIMDVKGITEVPAGETKADFQLSVDQFADENGVVAKLEVIDQQTGKTLGSLEVSNWDFQQENASQTFEVPLTAPDSPHPLELRVMWTGKSSLRLYSVTFQSPRKADEAAMFETLRGVVNSAEPRIYDEDKSGTYWLDALGLSYTRVKDNWQLMDKYRKEVKGIVVYDPDVPDTYNLATTIAGLKKAVVAAPSLLEKLTGEPYKLPIVEDLRGKYKSNIEVYDDLYSRYWSQTTHKVLVGLSPDLKTNLREYAMGIKAAVVWLNPAVPEEEALLNKFMKDMPYGTGLYLGWWPDEQQGVTKTSEFGLATVAADYSSNLSVLSGTSRNITLPKPPVKPPLENKVYLTYIVSDGDNLQYIEGTLPKLWDNPDRGKIPLGWTVSPLMADAMPGVLDYLNRTATDNDVLISGPSGMGYTYPNLWTDQKGLDQFFARTNTYMSRAGMNVLTVWNTVVGPTNPNVGQSIAEHAPSLLGFTSQGNTGVISVYNDSMPGQELQKGYGSSEPDLTTYVEDAMKTWDHNTPLFVGIQAQPWSVSYQDFEQAYDYFKDNKDIAIVRPDVYFELMRESKHLPVHPEP
ncbi:GxGYxYP domain-containing protein [Paenibacillus protaetiae]|nr:GxGYxYP domain-containing protein [Paenibacillus protaetiae]